MANNYVNTGQPAFSQKAVYDKNIQGLQNRFSAGNMFEAVKSMYPSVNSLDGFGMGSGKQPATTVPVGKYPEMYPEFKAGATQNAFNKGTAAGVLPASTNEIISGANTGLFNTSEATQQTTQFPLKTGDTQGFNTNPVTTYEGNPYMGSDMSTWSGNQNPVVQADTGSVVGAGSNNYDPYNLGTEQIKQFQASEGLTVDGLMGPETQAQYDAMQRYNQNTADFDDYVQSGTAAKNGVNTDVLDPSATDTGSMFGDFTSKDIASGLFDVAGLGLSAYGMFEQLDQGQQRIDTGNAQLQLSRDEYNENLRQRQAVAAQNKVS